jgi:hypothetical protein
MEHISQLRIERWDVQVLPGLDSGGHIRELHTGRYELGPKASRIPTVLILTQLEEVMISSTANFQTALTAFKNGQLIFLVTIAGYSRVFTNYPTGVGGQYDWIESVDDINQTIQAIEGGADQTSWGFTVQDKTGLVTADFPGFTFEGKQVTVQVGFVGLAQVDFCTIFTGIVDTVANANSNNSYYFTCLDISAKLAQVVYVTGDDGINPVSSKNLKTINGHPLDILLDILSNKIGLPGGQIDTTKIQAYRDGPFSGVQFTFRLSQSVTAHDFIKAQLLKPLGGYLWVNALGKMTVNFFYPLAAPAAVASLGPGIWESIPDAEQVDMINTVQFQFDKDDLAGGTGNYNAVDTETYAVSVAKYGQYGEQVIPADGMRSALQAFFTAKLVSRMYFYRYGLKNLTFNQNAADAILQAMLLEPGDLVSVTHPAIPDRIAGTIGITAKLFEVLDKTFKLSEGKVTLTMIDASYLSTFGTYKIAPTGKGAYAAVSAPDKARYMFMCDNTDHYSNGDAAHALG